MYCSQGNVLMTEDIFMAILRAWNQKLQPFFADNAECHPKDSQCQFSHIKVVYLPPNISIIQPLGWGIIQNTKVNYHKYLLKYVLSMRK